MKQRRYFEWIAGDSFGVVEILDSISEFDGEYFYNFVSGESVNERFISKVTSSSSDLKEKFMVEVNNMSNVWTIEQTSTKKFVDHNTGEESEIPTLHDILKSSGNGSQITIDDSDYGKDRLVPPRNAQKFYELPSYIDFAIHEDKIVKIDAAEPVISTSNDIVSDKKESCEKNIDVHEPMVNKNACGCDRSASCTQNDPVRILVTASKKKPAQIELSLDMSLPGKDVYRIADENFEDGGRKMVEYIVEDFDMQSIIKSVMESLTSFYSN